MPSEERTQVDALVSSLREPLAELVGKALAFTRSITVERGPPEHGEEDKLWKRTKLRERVAVEHSLAHIAARKGATARYMGVRKNRFDLRRASAIQNLETLHLAYRKAA